MPAAAKPGWGYRSLAAVARSWTKIVVPWRREVKYCCLPIVIYLAALAWENLLVPEAAVTRFMLLGALLVALMAVRPQGLLGKHRVEVV